MEKKGEVLSLATPQSIIMGKFWLLWVYKSQVNAFAAVVNLKMLSDPDAHTKPQPQSPCAFIKISLYFANPKLYSM